MIAYIKKIFTPTQKAEVAPAALKGKKTLSQIASIYEAHPTQLGFWKKTAQQGLTQLFTDKRKKRTKIKNESLMNCTKPWDSATWSSRG
ncbi:MAG: transposase [Candidatus Sungbacteria bacterium]|nr:transposase [Candidatus Sungbacteria bacterium]